jgi:ATP-dependent DNA ligase
MISLMDIMANLIVLGPTNLYKIDNTGSIRHWKGWVEQVGSNHVIKVSTGVKGGKMTTTKGVVITKGKAGRTLGQQSKSQFDSIVQKKKDSGYTTNTSGRGSSGGVRVSAMLAQNYEKHAKKIKLPAVAQPKLDGVRCLAQMHKGKVILLSRNNKPFPELPGIRDAIKNIKLPEGIILDGELYSTELGKDQAENFQRVVGLVRKQKLKPQDVDDSKKVKLNVFDLIDTADPGKTFAKRYKEATSWVKKDSSKRLTMVPIYQVKSDNDIQKLLTKNLQDGYEGVMIRNVASPYEGKRSYNLQKYKKFDDEEFKIVGYQEGQGNDAGTVIWTCEVPKTKKRFTVRPKGTRAERAKLLKDGKKYVGKKLTVKFQDYTSAGIPRFPVGLTIRDYE